MFLNPSKKRLSNITSSLLWLIMERPLFHRSALNWNRSNTLKPASWMITGIYKIVSSNRVGLNEKYLHHTSKLAKGDEGI